MTYIYCTFLLFLLLLCTLFLITYLKPLQCKDHLFIALFNTDSNNINDALHNTINQQYNQKGIFDY